MKALRLLLILFALIIGACTTFGYYGQSLAGQMELMQKQQPVSRLLTNSRAAPELKQRLTDIQSMLDYAHTQLSLPDNGSYRSYAELGREYLVWNVFAAPEFSLQPKQWCYLIIGCTSYRGYFQQQQAQTYARTLKQSGWEVSVNGISAYSTLGWLRDPLLNTMINRENWQIARLLFHELAHQIIYIPNDTEFNEAFADAVAGIGLRRWLQAYHPDMVDTVQTALEREESLYRLLFAARDNFIQLYSSSLPADVMREQKALLHERLQQDYQQLKQQWDTEDNRYDRWVTSGINNASLAALSTYRSLVPAFEDAWRLHEEDLPRLYKWVEGLSGCNKTERLAKLQRPEAGTTCRG